MDWKETFKEIMGVEPLESIDSTDRTSKNTPQKGVLSILSMKSKARESENTKYLTSCPPSNLTETERAAYLQWYEVMISPKIYLSYIKEKVKRIPEKPVLPSDSPADLTSQQMRAKLLSYFYVDNYSNQGFLEAVLKLNTDDRTAFSEYVKLLVFGYGYYRKPAERWSLKRVFWSKDLLFGKE